MDSKELEELLMDNVLAGNDWCNVGELLEKEKKNVYVYKRSARAEARMSIKKNATTLLQSWTVCPFSWKKNKFRCAYCTAEFLDCDHLRAHVENCAQSHSVKDIYSKFKEMSIINVDLTNATCRFCSVPLTDLTQMKSHVLDHGQQLDSKHPDGILPFFLNKDIWQCVICSEKFNNFLKLYEHMNVHYQHFICSVCGKGYMTAPRLRKHAEVHISGYFPCKICGRIFNMRAQRDCHKAQVHAKGPRYECPHCNMRFEGYYDRMKHLNVAHKEKKVSYECIHCDMTFHTSGKRANHLRTVHFPPERDYRCTECEWSFKNRYELKRHLIKHTGEKNFHCSVCGKSFLRSRNLKNHMKTHEGVKTVQPYAQVRQNLPRLSLPDLTDLLPSSLPDNT